MAALTYLIISTTLFTGFSGLVYEVAWQKYLANLLGSQAQATALVLAVFLGGLAVGYQLFGNLSRRRSTSQLVKMTGWAELLIGLWAFFFDSIFNLVMSTFGILDPTASFSFALDVFVTTIVIGFPTVLMGVTLPLLTQALSTSLKNSGPMHARIYSVNTAGAFLGCLLGGFVLLPKFGLPLTMFYLSFANIICGLTLVFVGKYLPNDIPKTDTPNADQSKAKASLLKSVFGDRDVFPLNITALLAGFCALTIQTTLIRLIGMTMGSSEYAFSMVVSAYILLLALGAWRIAKKEVSPASLAKNQITALIGLVVVYFTINYWSYSVHLVRITFSTNILSFYGYYAAMFLVMLTVLYVPVGAMGRTMPLLFRSSSLNIELVGKSVGSIYAWNAIGCVAGAYFGGYLLYYIFNIDDLLRISIGLMGVTALLTLPKKSLMAATPSFAKYALPAVIVAIAATYFLPDHAKKRFALGLFRLASPNANSFLGAEVMHKEHLATNRILFYKDGPTGALAVLEQPIEEEGQRRALKSDVSRSLIVNGKSDGLTCCSDKITFELAAHIPALLQNGESGRTAIVGFGTGISAGVLSAYENIKQIDIFEISPTVRQIADLFDFANDNVTKNPKVSWFIGDAYRSLGASKNKYSIIMSNPSNPWVAGVERLFSQDFYKLTKSKLETGGVYAQWFHLYSMSPSTVSMVINTFSSVFPQVRIFALDEKDLCLIGSEEPIDDAAFARMTARFSAGTVKEKLEIIGFKSVDAVLGQEYPISVRNFEEGGLHSLDFPRLSFSAGMDFFMQKQVDFNEVSAKMTAMPWVVAGRPNTLIAKRYPAEKLKTMSETELVDLMVAVCKLPAGKVEYERVAAVGRRNCLSTFWAIIKERDHVENVSFSDAGKQHFKELTIENALPANISKEQANEYLSSIINMASNGVAITKDTVGKLADLCGRENTGSDSICLVNGINAAIAVNDLEGAKSRYESLRATELYHRLKPAVLSDIELSINTLETAQNRKAY